MASRKVTSLPVTEKTVCETNADQNRTPIDRIILHTEVGSQAAADHRFNDCNSKVSVHYGVSLDGSIWHWVDEDWVAYHAGDYSMNQRSLGIEHEDNGLYNDPRPDILYTSSAQLVADICKFYNIPCDRTHILKHSEVIATGCPDALDVDRIVREASAILNPPIPESTIIAQSKYDFGTADLGNGTTVVYGVMEMQQVKSELLAKDKRIDELGRQLTNCKNKPTYIQTLGFWDRLRLLFARNDVKKQ